MHSSYKNSALCQRGPETECEFSTLAEDLGNEKATGLLSAASNVFIINSLSDWTLGLFFSLVANYSTIVWMGSTAVGEFLNRMNPQPIFCGG